MAAHAGSSFTQCSRWRYVKEGWDYTAIISEDAEGRVRGAVGLLIRPLPLGLSFLYAPRGPVCDLSDREALRDLKAGCDAVAKARGAYALTWDPDTLITPTASPPWRPWVLSTSPADWDLRPWARFNYHDLTGHTEESLIQSFSQNPLQQDQPKSEGGGASLL